MAITRTPIIDDDGTGTTGTVIDNAWKTELYNQIDGGIGGGWTNVPFNAADYSAAAPMVWTVGAAAIIRNRYTIVNKILVWSFYLSWFSGANVLSGSPSPTLNIKLPAGLLFGGSGAQYQPIVYCIVSGVPVTGGLTANSAGAGIAITKGAGGNYALSDIPGLITTMLFEIS